MATLLLGATSAVAGRLQPHRGKSEAPGEFRAQPAGGSAPFTRLSKTALPAVRRGGVAGGAQCAMSSEDDSCKIKLAERAECGALAKFRPRLVRPIPEGILEGSSRDGGEMPRRVEPAQSRQKRVEFGELHVSLLGRRGILNVAQLKYNVDVDFSWRRPILR